MGRMRTVGISIDETFNRWPAVSRKNGGDIVLRCKRRDGEI
jgi:hypothetical protein